MKSTARTAIVITAACTLGLLACEEDDVGRECTPDQDPLLSGDPVGGEDPVTEVVSVSRDQECEAFVCLTHAGLEPYCTRECSYDTPDRAKSCDSDADCKKPLHCFEGLCQDDDCPKGFVCSGVQDVGPLAGKLYCVRNSCDESLDCEDVNKLSCKRYGCVDRRLYLNDDSLPSQLVCVARNTLECTCVNGGDDCPDDQFICDPADADEWPQGSVERIGYCVLKEE